MMQWPTLCDLPSPLVPALKITMFRFRGKYSNPHWAGAVLLRQLEGWCILVWLFGIRSWQWENPHRTSFFWLSCCFFAHVEKTNIYQWWILDDIDGFSCCPREVLFGAPMRPEVEGKQIEVARGWKGCTKVYHGVSMNWFMNYQCLCTLERYRFMF